MFSVIKTQTSIVRYRFASSKEEGYSWQDDNSPLAYRIFARLFASRTWRPLGFSVELYPIVRAHQMQSTASRRACHNSRGQLIIGNRPKRLSLKQKALRSVAGMHGRYAGLRGRVINNFALMRMTFGYPLTTHPSFIGAHIVM